MSARKMTHLRISVTERCNLTCPYCHKEGSCGRNVREMSLEEIRQRAKAAAEAGIRKVKITGGEPLLREDIADIVRAFRDNGFTDISLTTNGLLLEKYAAGLKKAGLSRLNIGCDSISSEYLSKNSESIRAGLSAALSAGLSPIKLNMVVLRGVNDGEIENMIDFARKNSCILQLIELIRLNVSDDFYKQRHFPLKDIEEGLEKRAERVIERELQGRRQYVLPGVTVEVIRPGKKSFCSNCTKVRIAADGRIKPCLLRNDTLVEFKDSSSFLDAFSKKGEGNESGCD